ncbi:MAG: PA2778 family cysteine peptidase [Gammaproteobacteria bacterium]|nr:PA2778 family cysteine peptidase [Gammaproteobacteria bacterium]
MRKIALLAILILVGACASAPQTQQLLATPTNLPGNIELSHIPFFPQQRYQCGPAALATVLKHSGVNVNVSTLVDEIYLPSRLGSLQPEILASTRRHNRLPYRIAPDMRTLLSEIAAGNPILVLQNLGLSWAPQWHYAVVTGFDLNKREIILRSGTDARHITNMDTFELTWARSRYWGIAVLSAETLPASADAERYLRTVVALENTQTNNQQWSIIHTAYRTALSRWPNNLIAQMGLGNSAYQMADLNAAAQAFRNVVRDHPDTGAAYNNLAQVLLEQGKLHDAEKQAKRAVNLGGKYQKNFRATLADIQRAKTGIRQSPDPS